MVFGIATSVLFGVIFGLALAAPPGPMNAIIATESVNRGWVAGFRAGLGAMAADLLFFWVALLGAVTIIDTTVQSVMVTVGGLLMFYFAVGAATGISKTPTEMSAAGRARSFSKTFVLGLTNPYQILFWLTVGVGLLTPGTIDLLGQTPLGTHFSGILVVETGSPILIVGLFAGILCWIVVFPALLVVAKQRVQRLAPAIAAGSALVLAVFGVMFLVDGLAGLL